MIVYQLCCGNDHEFEAWFRDSETYTEQAESGDILCPFCGITDVRKAIMAPNIATSKRSREAPDANRAQVQARAQAQAQARAHEVAENILEAVGKLREHVEANCEDVGENFAEEARRIHYGEVEERGIYGKASDNEAEELGDEGIDFYRLPIIRRDS
ncbi:MAG: hypothetical protein CBB68_01080 [Rhodospirillaceae bacterium TMED8]|nr:hypothetical protein [Magnetovibrio sp.]OUT53292.1 MAG: hypothetical protein CBB68_01080 [Rhodospirillaceae bacterium TMED8]|tara:strand:- start:591 stop:1061 length:471 start_codon:yes stop_codon:yes gene_type:complete